MDALQELQRWFYAQCNGDWEHSDGVKIGTLDNPGWWVTIDLADTEIADHPFTRLERLKHDTDWILCEMRDQKFEGRGGPLMLEEILKIFLAWAKEAEGA